MDADAVARVYSDGVAAVAHFGRGLTSGQWLAPACGSWSAADTVRHLVSVAEWYHDWLDRAIDGDATIPFPGESIDAYTAAALADHQHLSTAEAVAEFERSASAYLIRARARWELPYGFPFGTVTVGLHAGAAAAEWHLHAWDLSTVTGVHHHPEEPELLLRAAAECVAATSGRWKAAAIRRVVPIMSQRAPWETMLRRTGRG